MANGLIPTLLKSVRPEAPPKTVPLVADTPKPRLVKLEISRSGEDAFSTASNARRASHYTLKVHIGGVSGLLAPLWANQPPDCNCGWRGAGVREGRGDAVFWWAAVANRAREFSLAR